MLETSYFIIGKLNSVKWEDEPFRYFYEEDIFPADMYQRMMEEMPEDDEYKQYNEIYKNRFINPCKKGVWKEVSEALHGMFPQSTRVQLLRDFSGYEIGPHTDGPRELYTILFYLPEKEIPDAGTCVYTPKQEGFTHNGKAHLKREDFNLLKKASFKPNSCFGFKRSDDSFHGVEQVDVTRNLIQLSVYK